MNSRDSRIIEELVAKYGGEELIESINSKDALKKLAIGAALVGASIGGQIHHNNKIEREHTGTTEYYNNPYKDYNESDELFQKKVEAVERTFDRKMRRLGKGLSGDDVNLDPENIVRLCDKYNFDLPGLLSHSWLESSFGTSNLATKTGSVFSQGLTDEGVKPWGYFDTQDDSVEAYIKLICSDYLFRDMSKYGMYQTKASKYTKDMKERDFTDLLKDGAFVNYYGKAYATQKPDENGNTYEDKLRSIRNEIIANEPILAQNSSTYQHSSWD